MSLCFGRGWSRRGRIAPNKRDNLFSANQKCDSRRRAKNDRHAKTAQRRDAFALRSSKIQPRGNGLFPPLRLVKWVRNETLQSLKTAPSQACLCDPRDRGSFWKSPRDASLSRDEAGLMEQRQTVLLIPARYPLDDLNPSCRLTPYFSEIHSRLMSSLNHSRSLCRISLFVKRKIHTRGAVSRDAKGSYPGRRTLLNVAQIVAPVCSAGLTPSQKPFGARKIAWDFIC